MKKTSLVFFLCWMGCMPLCANPNQDLLLAAMDNNYKEALRKSLSALDAGARATFQDDDGNTALHRAIGQRNEKLALLLIERFFDEARKEAYPQNLFENVKGKRATNAVDKKKVAELFSQKIDIANYKGETPLIKATCFGLIKIMEKLIQAGANIQETDVSILHLTPLMHAILEDRIAAVKLLLKHGARANDPDKNRTTPLSHASYRGQSESVKELLKYGADLSVLDTRNRSALHYAIMGVGDDRKKLDMVNLLLNHSGLVNAGTYDGGALSQAAYRGQTDIMNMLIKKGANIDETDGWWNTPLHYAVAGNRIGAVRLLLKKGADISRKAGQLENNQARYLTVFEGAVITGNQEIIQLIIDAARKVHNAEIMKQIGAYQAGKALFEHEASKGAEFSRGVWINMTQIGETSLAS